MTKLYMVLPLGYTEADAIQALIEGNGVVESSFEKLVEELKEDGDYPEGEVFIFELVDRGTIATTHKFVSSKKEKIK